MNRYFYQYCKASSNEYIVNKWHCLGMADPRTEAWYLDYFKSHDASEGFRAFYPDALEPMQVVVVDGYRGEILDTMPE